MKTHLVALDVYGTFLDSEDFENACPPRKGFEEFVEKCKSLNLKLITSSDSDVSNLMTNIEETFKNSRYTPKPTLDIFESFYRLSGTPKDFSGIIEHYNLTPEQLFVIGDNYEKDIAGAEALGCSILHVPEYNHTKADNPLFNFKDIEIP